MNRRILRGGKTTPSFEQVVPAHEFSELVRFGVALAKWLVAYPKRREVRPSSGVIDGLSTETTENG